MKNPPYLSHCNLQNKPEILVSLLIGKKANGKAIGVGNVCNVHILLIR
jgi:hypothetical protein